VPERTTTLQHDDSGNVTGWSEYVESEWDDQQQAIMIALAVWEASRCPACGGDPEECQGAANEFAWRVDGPVRCHRTKARRDRERDYLKGKDTEVPDSLLYRTVRR